MVPELRKIALVAGFLLTAAGLSAQDGLVRRGNCLPEVVADDNAAARADAPRRLPAINRDWDPNRIYRQAVILVSFSDTDFSMDDPVAFYQAMFNEQGFNQRQGSGCVADYFRDQSGGLFNLQFDIFGPYQVSTKAQPYDAPTENTKNYGGTTFRAAAEQWMAANPQLDYAQYDWNGDGRVNQVIYVFAGYGGNESNANSYGHVWPNTSTFTKLTTPTGLTVANYTASAELWVNNTMSGLGTVCHEFSHSLGLPDIYPTNGWTYSAVDEWDLMDGGNFTNRGWCPPNYSGLEKMLMGWLTPVDLTEPTTVSDMKPVSQGGTIYRVKATDTEYYLLENRQWDGWDAGVPGKGLVVFHVNYVASSWAGNTPNNTRNQLNYSLVHADNRDYDAWTDYLMALRDAGEVSSQYQNGNRMNSYFLSGSPYPYGNNNQLTDESTPAATVYSGSGLMGQAITNIKVDDAGRVGFDFMGGSDTTAITEHVSAPLGHSVAETYDLQGCRLKATASPRSRLTIVRLSDGSVRKVLVK